MDGLTASYRTLLARGRVETWKFINSRPDEPEAWWSALEQLAASDGLRLKRGWNGYGGNELVVPDISIAQPDGTEYRAWGAESAEAARAEIQRRMLDDWGDTLTRARARHGATNAD